MVPFGFGLPRRNQTAHMQGIRGKRLMGFEPTTFCMASRRSSQLSYSRAKGDSSPWRDGPARRGRGLAPAGQAAVHLGRPPGGT